MSFLNPFFLIGLVAVAVPVAIHLINLRRPEKLPFSTLSFFRELQKSTIRRLKLKQYLLLFLRTAAVLLLALALARPFLPPSLSGGSATSESHTIALLIDNSPSMGQIDENGPFFDQAKKLASDILDDAGSDDRILVQKTNGEAADWLFTGPEQARLDLENISVENKGSYTSARLLQLADKIRSEPGNDAVVYWISDGQKYQMEALENSAPGSAATGAPPVSVQPILVGKGTQRNVAVNRIALKSQMISRDKPLTLEVEVQNYGQEAVARQFVSLEADGDMAGQYETKLAPGETKQFLFEVVPGETGDLRGQVIIEGDDMTFDNHRYFVVEVPKSRSVLRISTVQRPGDEFASYLQPALEAARAANTQLDVRSTTLNRIAGTDWSQYDAVILDGLREVPEYLFPDLQRLVQQGGGLVFLPSEKGDIANYNHLLNLFDAGRFNGVRGSYGSFKAVASIEKLVEGHPVLDQIFRKKDDEDIQLNLPELFYYYRYRAAGGAGSFRILKSTLDDPLLTEQRFGEGRIMISAIGADPGWSNFPVNPLFAPLFYRTVLYAASSEQGSLSDSPLGHPFEWTGDIPGPAVELQQDSLLVKPETEMTESGYRVTYQGEDLEPGWFTLSSDDWKRSFAVNQNIMESDLATLRNKDLANNVDNRLTVNRPIDAAQVSLQEVKGELKAAGFGREIWYWFAGLAFLLLVAETVLSKGYKAETIE